MNDLKALALERLRSQLRWPISELIDCIQNMYVSENDYARRLIITEAAKSYVQASDLTEALQKTAWKIEEFAVDLMKALRNLCQQWEDWEFQNLAMTWKMQAITLSSYLKHKIVWTLKRTETILSKSILTMTFLLSCTFDRHARDFTHELDANLRWILFQSDWNFLKISVIKYTSKRARARELISENLSHTRQEFFRATSVLFKLDMRVSELKNVRIEESVSSEVR